jgi:predicted lipoprotein with Yx(FWY)xxD motif
MKTKFMLISLAILALVVSACASATPMPATAVAVIPVTGSSTNTPAGFMPTGPAAVNVGQSPAPGSFLVDSKGMTLYLFTKDTPNTSNCYGACATYWPPLLTTGAPLAGTGVTAAMLGTTARTDGSTQVTYNGWPLYYYAGDKAAGDTTGENVKTTWFVISPAGVSVTGAPAATAAPAAASAGALVNAGQNAALGSFLVDSNGMTLYVFANDSANTSNCSGTCSTNWPPLLTNGAPIAGTGVSAALLGTITRADGSSQVTYNGMPLYYFAADKTAGDTKGQAVKNIWYVIDPTGKSITTAPAAAAASASAGAVVNVGQNSALGSFLVDSKGMTLYLYTKDTPNTSACYGSCASYWPPLLTSGAPVAGTGVTASMLGSTNRTDGTIQVTYNGWPLYYFASDKAAGDTTGENVQSVWFVITPAGIQK